MRVLACGDSALLLEPDDPGLVLPLADACRSLDGVREVVPAARTVLLMTDGAGSLAPLSDTVRALDVYDLPATSDASARGEIVLDVVYDGPDLASTAGELGLDVDGLVRAHADGSYEVAFCGFVPGFAYLTGLPETLHAARLDSPRTRVPTGSVGVAGEFTGVYPRASPGGWRLLARTDTVLFDPNRTPPALLTPGTRVRFRPLTSS